MESGRKNVQHRQLFESRNILLSPLHIKFDYKDISREGFRDKNTSFMYVQNRFSSIIEAKLKEGIFFGLQIGKILLEENFDRLLRSNIKQLHENNSSQ